MQKKSYSIEIGGKTLTADFTDLADQAHGSVIVRYGNSAVLATAVMGEEKAGMGSGDVIAEWRKEILSYLEEMYGFREENNPIEIMKKLSAFSSRVSYMRNVAIRSSNKQVQSFRLEEIDPFLRETEFQFKVWSRVSSVVAQEWEMAKG
jgi:hypothetical protein